MKSRSTRTDEMKRNFLIAVLSILPLTMLADDHTSRHPANGDVTPSLTERVLQLEKNGELFNVYLHYSAHAQTSDEHGRWQSAMGAKVFKVELAGSLTDKLSYNFIHRLNKGTSAESQDNFARATDGMSLTYDFNPQFSLTAGKTYQIWGGFEYWSSPVFVFQYSDMEDHMEIYTTGVVARYKPVSSQEIGLEICNSHNGKFADTYSRLAESGISQPLESPDHPFSFILNWNGNFFSDRLQTRWAWGIQSEARHRHSRMLALGQQLCLPKFQWYVDYMAAFDGLDRLQLASNEGRSYLKSSGRAYFTDVHYQTIVTKMEYQFQPRWNLVFKGMYETANVTSDENFKNYRRSISYGGFVEYIPDTQLNLHLFLGYMGKTLDYTRRSALTDIHTNRIELGFMSKLKLY